MKPKLTISRKQKARIEVLSRATQIKKPMKLHEIISSIESFEYNAEMIIQHFLVWLNKNTKGSK